MPNFFLQTVHDVYEFFWQGHENRQKRVRIPVEVARLILLNNRNIIFGTEIRYFYIKNIGLGVCEIEVNEHSASKETLYDKCGFIE